MLGKNWAHPIFVFFFLLFSASACSCQLACSTPPPPTSSCRYAGFDFGSLMGKDLAASDGSGLYNYYVNVCGDLSSSSAQACTQQTNQASVCQINEQTQDAYVIGRLKQKKTKHNKNKSQENKKGKNNTIFSETNSFICSLLLSFSSLCLCFR